MAFKKALIFGISGQDGQWLALTLLKMGYAVMGTSRRNLASPSDMQLFKFNKNKGMMPTITPNFDLSNDQIRKLIADFQPDEIYHLSSLSFVEDSWENPSKIIEETSESVLAILETLCKNPSKTSFYFSGTSELFGDADLSPQSMNSCMYPRSPYASAKHLGYNLVRNFRNRYNVRALTGLTYNHESELRPSLFSTRKITQGFAEIFVKKREKIRIGNIQSTRDWGYAPDYVEAMHLLLQAPQCLDQIICTGVPNTIENILQICGEYLNINWRDVVELSENDFRPQEKVPLLGNPNEINKVIGWRAKTNLKNMIIKMLNYDISLLKEGEEQAYTKYLLTQFNS